MFAITPRLRQRGFNLVETSIVLGLTGLVIGGVWTAAATMQRNARITRMAEDLSLVKGRLIGTKSLQRANLSMAELLDIGFFPPSMVKNGAVYFSETLPVSAAGINSGVVTMTVDLSSYSDCITVDQALRRLQMSANFGSPDPDADGMYSTFIGKGSDNQCTTFTNVTSSGYSINVVIEMDASAPSAP